MKTIIKFCHLLLTLTLCFLLCSCALFTDIANIYNGLYSEEEKLNMSKADEFIQNFLLIISNGDMTEAEKYMHPQFSKDNGSLTDYLSTLEKNESVDFSQGIYIERMISKNKSSAYFFHNGYCYEGYTIKYDILIGNIQKTCKISVCDNNDGYGIYEIIFVKK